MKILINKTDKNILPITKIYDLGSVTTTIDDLLNESTIILEKNITPILSIDGSNYLINNFNSTNIKEDFEAVITESDLISLGGGADYLKKDIATYTPATTPLSGTEKALIHDGTDFKKVAVSEFIYATDGKSYESLSSAMAVIPLPENNTIFYIDESNLTEKGLYAYDSSEASGYRFVRDYTPNGIVEQANTKAVSGGEVYEKIKDKITSDDLTDYIQKNQEFPTWTATTFISGSKVSYLGKFWKSNASTVGTDVPGTSSKWVELLSGYEEKTPVTDFIKSLVTYTPNLYNSENIQYNKYIDPADGIIKTITNGIISGFISVDVLKKYTVKSDISLGLINFKTIGFYDVNFAVVGYSTRNPITGLPENVNCNVTYNDFLWDTGVLPTGTKYVVFTLRGNDITTAWSTANITMREFGYSSDINSEIVTDEKMESAINTAVAPYLKDSELAKVITLPQTYEEGSLFNISGGGIGNILASPTWLRTGLTPVTALDTMFVKGVLGGGNFYIVFYNSDTPSNASYVANIRPNFVASATKVYEFIVPIGATHVGFNIGTNTTYNFAQLKESFVFSTNQSFYSTKEIVGYSVRKNNLLNLSSLVWNSGGDSITWQDEKNFTTGLDAGNLAIGYQTLVRRKIQFRKHNNCGISGFALSASTPDDGKSWIKEYNTFPVADVFTLAHGTNDYRLNRPLGTQADYDNNTGNLTFYGSLRIFIDSCYLANPLYKIILITPLQRNADGYTGWSANLLGHTLNDYADAIRYVGLKESLPVIDLLKTSGINLKNISQYTSDGLHPNNLGYEVMAIPIIAEMEKINF